jgi:hypothetical protein
MGQSNWLIASKKGWTCETPPTNYYETVWQSPNLSEEESVPGDAVMLLFMLLFVLQ